MSDPRRRLHAAAGILAGAAALFSAQAAGDKAPPPIVRRDLVRTSARTFPQIKRDLFSTARFSAAFAAGRPGGIWPEADRPPAGEPAPPPPAVIRYVGYIKYAAVDKTVALVVINGEAWAVSEGEVFGAGWTAVRVSEKEVELRNPEGNTEVFLYQEGQGEGQ